MILWINPQHSQISEKIIFNNKYTCTYIASSLIKKRMGLDVILGEAKDFTK